jgi:PAS domain-containing protein
VRHSAYKPEARHPAKRFKIALFPSKGTPRVLARNFYDNFVAKTLTKQQAQDTLQESENSFRALIENARDIISMLSSDGEILYQSPSVTRVLGYAPAEMIGTSTFAYIIPTTWKWSAQTCDVR